MSADPSGTAAGEPPRAGLAIVSTFAWSGTEPLRGVVHDAEGTWQFLCGTTDEPRFLLTVHARHAVERFAADLAHLPVLPPGSAAWRDGPGDDWEAEPAPP